MATLLLTTGEAASELRVGRSTVDYLAAQGILPAVHIGRCRRFRRDDIEAFVAGLGERPAPGRPASRAAEDVAVG